MPLELFRTAGSEACVVTVHGEDGWRFHLDDPSVFVLCFMNAAFLPLLTAESRETRQRQAEYFRRAFADPALAPLRDLINHVLVCAAPRGFDPIVRLAAYTYANGLSGLLSYAGARALETSVVGSRAAAAMARNWGALLEDSVAQTKPRDILFEALLDDAAARDYPFELGVSAQYPSPADLLCALVGEMIESRRLLRRCPVCDKYFIADALPLPCACGGRPQGAE